MVGMMHFTPDQVRRMSLAEIGAAIDGFQEFNGGKKADDHPTLDEVYELMKQFPDK